MRTKILFLFATILFVSCSLDDDAADFEFKPLAIKEAIVPSEFIFGSDHDVTIKYDLPDGCHSFNNLIFQQEGTARIIAVNALVQQNVACTLAIVEKEFTFSINILQREDYILKFWKGTDNTGNDIFEEIIVPVNE